MKDVEKIVSRLETLSLNELREVNRECIDLIKEKRRTQSKRNLRKLSEGERVAVMDDDGNVDFEGKVIRKKRTKAIVEDEESGKRWNVPAVNIEKY